MGRKLLALRRFALLLPFLALLLVLVGAVCRFLYIDLRDQYKCGALLNGGLWLDSSEHHHHQLPFQTWQPSGCVMHTYEKTEIEKCLYERRLVFVGDSTIRQIYWAVADKMGHGGDLGRGRIFFAPNLIHPDHEFTSGGTTVQYFWDPWLNSTALERELKAYSTPSSDSASNDKPAASILVGAPGLWFARLGRKNHFKEYTEAIDKVIAHMNIANTTIKNSIANRQPPSNLLLLAPIQVPAYDMLDSDRKLTITSAKIDAMNTYLQQTSGFSNADVVWSYSLMTRNLDNAHTDGGVHVVDSIAHRKADILLNLRCNSEFPSRGYPHDGTCCMNYTQVGSIQLLMIVSAVLLSIASLAMRFLHTKLYSPKLFSLGAFLLVLSFAYLADRTQIFNKAHKQFRPNDLFASIVFLYALALLEALLWSMIGIHSTNRRYTYNHEFLNRDQTDEWKGWMQATILVYHYTGASKSLPIYQLVRVYVASYLFMTGYGNTLHFLRSHDYSLHRVATVLVRLNLLSVALSYMMRTDYVFYFFPALVSFWFMVIYSVLRFGKDQNYKPTFIIVKIVLSALFTKLLAPKIWVFAAFLLRFICGLSWNAAEWEFRLGLDPYIVYIGMMTALFHQRCHHLHELDYAVENAVDRICLLVMRLYQRYKSAVLLFTGAFFCGFWVFATCFTSKTSYNKWQPYLSSLPILCFILLRNASQKLRNYHSAIFAWLGRISLETFLLQYHIWLAADTKALLRLGLFGRGEEAFILTVLFIWLSWRTSKHTRELTNWFVGVDRSKHTLLDDDGLTIQLSAYPSSPAFMTTLHTSDSRTTHHYPVLARRCRNWFWIGMKVLEGDLRWRLLVLFVVLWLANLTYQ